MTQRIRTAIVIGAILALGFVMYLMQQPTEPSIFTPESALQELKSTNPSTHEAIERNIDDLVDAGGIEGALAVVDLAFANKDIFMNECHALAHSIGHYAPSYYNYDYDELIRHSSRTCARGYFHGAEAQLILEGPDYPERLAELCIAERNQNPGHTCLHGAGHALLNKTLNVQQSLDLCDDLGDKIGKPLVQREDVADCYEAVFSEVTNISGGYDGETGRHYEGEPPIFIESTPLEFCASFEQKYHTPCGLEFSAQGVSLDTPPSEVGRRLQECLTDAATTDLSRACFFNIASMYVRHEIKLWGGVTFQDWVLEEPEEIRLLYIVAVGHEIAEHLNSGHGVDSDAFCDRFEEPDEVEICKKQVHTTGTVVQVINK